MSRTTLGAVLTIALAADGTVVFGTAIGGPDDQWLAQLVAQGLQLVECGFVD